MAHDTAELTLLDLEPTSQFTSDVLAGLADTPKSLPCMYLYDERGSRLFEQICALDEYYLTRTEIAIFRDYIDEIVAALGADCLLIELGSGSSTKTRELLDHLEDAAGYVPVDISRDHLLSSAAALARDYPDLEVLPVCADFNQELRLPEPDCFVARRVVFFPGSTIGNLDRPDAVRMLAQLAETVGAAGGLLIGVDLKKDAAVLHAAYNDAAGVTDQFNRNLLHRINRELDAEFNVTQFAHEAVYNAVVGRMEIYLRSLADQDVAVAGEMFRFAVGERIHTENSYKYGLGEFAALAQEAGWRVEQVWTDPERLFSVQYLSVADADVAQ